MTSFSQRASILLLTAFLAFFMQAHSAFAVTKCIGQPTTLNWSSSNVAVSGCTLNHNTTNGTYCDFQPVADNSSSKSINLPSSSCTVSISCGSASKSDTLTIDTTKTWNGSACVSQPPPPPPPAPADRMLVNGASSATVPSGSYVTYSWSSSNATYCAFYIDGVFRGDTNGGWPFNNGAGWADGPLSANRTYTISCQNSVGQTVQSSATVTVTPNPAPIGWLDAAGCTYVAQGWTCDASNYNQALSVNVYRDGPAGAGGVLVGTYTAGDSRPDVGPSCGGTTLHGYNAPIPNSLLDGKTHSIYTYGVDVPTGTNTLLSGTPKSITCGCTNGATNYPTCSQCPAGEAYISGTCTPCSNGGCTGPGGNSGDPLDSLVCNNGATNPIACSTFAPTATLSASPTSIISGQSSTLTWSSTNATSCNAVGGFSTGGRTSGTASTGALTSTQNYQITCTGAGGSVSSNVVTVTVVQPTASITASPSRVHAGGSSTIAWSSTNVTSCTVVGPGISSASKSGSQTVTVNTQAIYTLTCQTAGAPITQTATVNIIPDFQEF